MKEMGNKVEDKSQKTCNPLLGRIETVTNHNEKKLKKEKK